MAKRKGKPVYFTPEPKWTDYQSITDPDAQAKAYQDCQYFIRTEIADKKKITIIRAWIKEESGWPDKDIEVILRNPDWAFSTQSEAVFFKTKVGYLPQANRDYVEKQRPDWVERGLQIKQEKEEKTSDNPNRPSIQDIMNDKLLEAGGEIDGLIDEWFENKRKLDVPMIQSSIMKFLNLYSPLAQHIPKLVLLYEKEKLEFIEVIKGKDDQLVEGYEHLTKTKLKQSVILYDHIISTLNSYATLKIQSRTKRKTKPISPEKAVSKLKYLKEFTTDQLKLKSVKPTALHLSKEAWVYDTGKRKLHHYVADDLGGEMFVKGNTLLGFDKVKSQIKTLRKPHEQIKEVMGSKPAARTYFDKIKSVGIRPTGRFNDHIIILKAHQR